MPVTVIGSGLSGLATAWYLSDQGVPVRVIDAAPQPGGLIQTRRVPEGLIESAARAFPWTERTRALFEAAGVPPTFAREASKRRYIFRPSTKALGAPSSVEGRDGRARRWPLTPIETTITAAHFARAWVMRAARPRGAESVEAWGLRVLGRAATTWLLAPALQGIYASPPHELSASALFGKGRPRGGRLAAPANGMGELIAALHEGLGKRGVHFELGCRASLEDVDRGQRVVICTNAPAAAALLARSAPSLAAAIQRIRMVSVVAATAFFAPRADDLRGFGILFPRGAGIAALGAVFNSDVFEGRSDRRSETWIYGDLDPSTLPGDEAAATAQLVRDRQLTGRADGPDVLYVTRQIAALPVYDAAILDAQAELRDLPAHIAIAGNFLGRLGVSSLIDGAAQAAARMAASTTARLTPASASADSGTPSDAGAGFSRPNTPARKAV
jgi:oxygen-dependent protoporphyrinogen oxidase